MITDVPQTASFWLIGILGILGLPPMGLFFSKFYIMKALFSEGYWLAGIMLIIMLAGVLMGILYHGMRMLSDKAKRRPLGDLLGKIDVLVLAVMLAATCIVGAGFESIPWINNLLNAAVRVIGG